MEVQVINQFMACGKINRIIKTKWNKGSDGRIPRLPVPFSIKIPITGNTMNQTQITPIIAKGLIFDEHKPVQITKKIVSDQNVFVWKYDQTELQYLPWVWFPLSCIRVIQGIVPTLHTTFTYRPVRLLT